MIIFEFIFFLYVSYLPIKIDFELGTIMTHLRIFGGLLLKFILATAQNDQNVSYVPKFRQFANICQKYTWHQVRISDLFL